ncbi:ABC transporter permease [Novosphingobium sp.]|uniref:ABC transporter permease n=1 Tax=Novosphingobium sp. TaxID=1874826 RepID=UPI001DA10240|nr:ABC transporter permease [Novosphingobium sp.]MBX9664029.1 ABC transporter permease [Novosphingobium sp.]
MTQTYPSGRIYAAGPRRLALRNQYNVLSALLFREAGMRHGQNFTLGYLASGIEPLVIVATIGLLFSALSRTPPYGSSLLLFIGTGVFPIYLFIHTSLRLRQPLNAVAQRQRFPIERPFDHILVHALLHLVSSAVVAIGFFASLYLFFGVNAAIPGDPVTAIAALLVVLMLGIATGILNSVIARIIPAWDLLWPAIARASLHFSGPYFVAAYLPPDSRWYFALNPVIHGVNWFRHAFYPFYPNQLTDYGYIVTFTVVLLFFGLLLEAGTRRFLEEKD